MRTFGCNHCDAQVQVQELINRRPAGWSTLRIDQATSESGPRRQVTKSLHQYDLCPVCTKEIKEWLTHA